MSKKKITNKSEIISDNRSYAEIVASLPENYSKPYESPFAEDARPYIYVYDKNKDDDTVLMRDTSDYTLITTKDSNLAGQAFYVDKTNGIRHYVKDSSDFTQDLKDKLGAFGIQMNKAYTTQQQKKERQERITADSRNSKQINSVGDILVKDSLPQLGYALQTLAGGIGTVFT